MSAAKINLNVRSGGKGIAILDIAGEVNAFAESALMDAYNQAVSSGAKTLILNFEHMEYMNSSGIGLLVTLLIRVQRQGQRLVAFGLTEHYRQIFELTRLNEAITLYESESAALDAVRVLA